VGTPEMMSRVRDAFPQVQLYWTEGGPDYTAPDYASDWAHWGRTYTQVLRNWCRGITGWNLALDEKGRPNIGPFSCGGLVTVDSRTKEISRSGQYWAFAHFSRNVQRGARRFESTGIVAGVEHVGFENPDGRRVLILTNSSDSKSVTLKLANQSASLSLPANSISTLSWS
jgi:glucosylceramidase